jgi:hypothetical protein
MQGIELSEDEARGLWPNAFLTSAPFPFFDGYYSTDFDKTDLFCAYEDCYYIWDEEGEGWQMTFCGDKD